MSGLAFAVLAGSLLLHAAVLVALLLARTSVASSPQEISVEIVQEAPKPAPPQPPPATPAKAEPVKSEPAKIKPIEAAPAEPPQPTPRREAAKPQPKPDPEPQPAADLERTALEKELAQLRAEQAALTSQDKGLGPLRESLQAVALPDAVESGEGDVVGYRAIVFSRLAKAKGDGGRMGRPGTAGVRFALDGGGRIARVEVAVSSGIAALDAEALAIVRRAAPFPVPPAGAERTFSANFSFVARGRS